jgi:hypothetical protein
MEMKKKMKNLYCARQRNKRTATEQAHGKGSFAVQSFMTHGKGSFAVRDARTHGIEGLHDNAGHLCRGSFLCRGLVFLFAVRLEVSLP